MPSKRDAHSHSKPCSLCSTPRDVLVRCQIDESGKWHLVCTGACWKRVSGGVMDGDGKDEHKYYRYGGMWKNKHEAVSAKKPKGVGAKKKKKGEEEQEKREEEQGDEGLMNEEATEGYEDVVVTDRAVRVDPS